MTGFHAHRHTSLLTRLRTHRLPGLVPAQDPETEPRLLSAQVDLDVLVLCSCSNMSTDDIQILLAYDDLQPENILFLNCCPSGDTSPEESTGKIVLGWPGSA